MKYPDPDNVTKENQGDLVALVLRDLVADHGNPDSAFYNQCDEYPCFQCELSRAWLKWHDSLPKP